MKTWQLKLIGTKRESVMTFSVRSIDTSGIPQSSLTNSGLLMALLMVGDNKVVSVNMVKHI